MRHKFLHCQELIKIVVFKSVVLVTKKFIGYIKFFFTQTRRLTALNHTLCVKKKYKLKVKKCQK